MMMPDRILAASAITILLSLALCGPGAAAANGNEGAPMTATNDDSDLPDLPLADAHRLAEVRTRVAAGDPELQPAVDALVSRAEAALGQGPFTVTDKTLLPPSGDPHDYMSVGPYWWPNPDTPDGLPYVRRDGETNPERHNYDNVAMSSMTRAVTNLGRAYFFTGDERFAEHAATLLRVWFLDEDTRMNPHLLYGQAIPGRVEGRGIGIIDTVGLVQLLHAVGMLGLSEAWTEEDHQGLQAWFSDYLDWMLTHKYGRDERAARNNHGTWYDVQAASYAIFSDRLDVAREVLEGVPENRILTQIEPDGRQPLELRRTRPFGYCVYNLNAFFELALLGERLQIDLWGFESEDGRSIRNALDWLVEHTAGESEWDWQGIDSVNTARLLPLLRMAANAWDEPAYEELLGEIAGDGWQAHLTNLLHPAR